MSQHSLLPGVLGRRFLGAALGLLLVTPTVARADNLSIELAVFARDIKQQLDKHDEKAVAVGQFTGPAALATSAGPGIAQRLIEELKKLKVEVRNEANYGVQGKYTDATDKESDSLCIALYVWIEDRRGNEIYRKGHSVFGNAELASLLGRNVSLPPQASRKEQEQALIQSIETPKVVVTKAEVKTDTDSPFALEVLIGGEPRPAQDRNGLAYVPIQRAEVYSLRVTNNADFEAAVRISIDGVSMFAFSDLKKDNGEPRYSWLIVPAHKSIVIPGWYINNQKSDSFQIVEYGESAVAKLLKNSGSVGTITAVFAACWETGKEPPPDEPKAYARHSRSADATGRGPRVDQAYTEVQRSFGADRAIISIRYTKD